MARAKSSKRPSAKSGKKPAASSQQAAAALASPWPRRIKLPTPKLFRLKRVKHPGRLPSAWQLTKRAARMLWGSRWLFLGITLVYLLLSIIFVSGLNSGADVTSLKQEVAQTIGGNVGQFTAGVGVFTTLLTGSGNAQSASAGPYEVFLGLIISLATIWALRQVSAGEHVRLKDVFYKGMYPLVPFVLVLIVILLQTLPFIAGGTIYSLVISYGIAVTLLEKVLWGLLFLILALISAYMLTSSLFALYIVTLPDMTPLKALRSAKKLVHYRRAVVFRKLLFWPVIVFLVAIIIMLPIIWFVTPVAPLAFLILALISLIATHAYLYTVYRELLA